MIGISVDDVEASRKLAVREQIRFPLLTDADLSVARRYVGVDDHDLAVPGVVLIRPDHTIAYRRISGDKTDRPTVTALLAEIDRVFGPPAQAPELKGGYAPIERLQLGLALGGGAIRAPGDWRGSVGGNLSALVPLGRHVLAGGGVGGEALGGRLDVDGALAARVPFLADLAEVQLVVRGGYSAGDLDGWHAGARLGFGAAATPSWGFHLSIGATVLRLGDDEAIESSLTLEIMRLVRIH